MRNRILSFLLAMVMITIYAPVTVRAETNGTCGENLTWTLDDNGTLTISGEGDMEDYAWYPPWFNNKFDIKSVVIEEGVTSIGNKALRLCHFTNISIPDSVTKIGKEGLAGSDLTSVNIGRNVTSIAEDALMSCSSLTEINVDSENPNYSSLDGVLFNKDKTVLLQYACGKADDVYTVPGGVDGIGYRAFYYSNLTNIILPDTVTHIDDGAFSSCRSLTNIEIPDSVTSVGSGVFYYCEALTDVNIPDSITGISKSMFCYCRALTNIIIPDTVTYIGDSAFSTCDKLTDIVIPENVTSIGSYAFAYCDGLTVVEIPEKVSVISDHAFYSCDGLINAVIPENVTQVSESAFAYCTRLTSVTMCGSPKIIDKNAFLGSKNISELHISDLAEYLNSKFANYEANPMYYAKDLYLNGERLTSVVIPDGITNIPTCAFRGCGLTSVTFPPSITNIEHMAFSYCSKLEDFYISDLAAYLNIEFNYDSSANPMSSADNLYLNGELVTSLEVPDGVTRIPEAAFQDCKSLTDIKLPDSINDIRNNAFKGCANLKDIVIPSGETAIAYYVFQDCKNLESITIPDTVKRICGMAFYGCDKLKDIYFVGTQNEWWDIDRESSNDPLNYANLHYTTKASVTENENSYVFKITPAVVYNYSTVYTALYDFSGRLLESKPTDYQKYNYPITVETSKPDNCGYAKIFVWGDNMQPLAAAKIIDL